ncbi:signal transduction histidine kinase [Diaminobutyricimonas aerilata]|uniref:histidine kinase n=1 Tax=Diaminobutyricimonas aerilata TaxID=1162967 RepID=A0A2M9CGH8_9MICO|nr:sensor histidine kinase [Diaminobutyricimonas aerilata]PJJ70970.1 signal transduction histidine kinase [Diaminobutyricimonas aerilata]
MNERRAMHLTVVIMTVVCAALVATAGLDGWRAVTAVVAVAAVPIGWVAFGRTGSDGNAPALAYTALLIVTTGLAVSALPVLSVLQCLSYPFVWILAAGIRSAIVANLGVGAAVTFGLFVSLGSSPDALAQIALNVGLSVGGSLVIGSWIAATYRQVELRQALLDELQAAQEELAALHRDAGITAERERLARELHDTIAQSLTGLVMLAQQARRSLAERDADAVEARMEQLESGAREALVETRTLVAAGAHVDLRSGLAAALTRVTERMHRESGITVRLEADLDAPVPRDVEIVLLRCVQEGLANVRKHSGATSVEVTLARQPDAVTVRVRDDGRGFDPAAPRTGFGLDGLRERLALANGTLHISSDEHGTELLATIPVETT